MRKLKIILLLVISAKTGFGQILSIEQEDDFLKISADDELVHLLYSTPQYFNSIDWQKGYAYSRGSGPKLYDGLKYNPTMDVMMVQGNENILPLYPDEIFAVTMEDQQSVEHLFVQVPLENPVFMEALSFGEAILLLHREVDSGIQEAFRTESLLVFETIEEPIEFNEHFYVWTKKDGVQKFKNSKKSLASLMGGSYEQVARYSEINGLKSKDINHLVQIFKYYNEVTRIKNNIVLEY